MAKQKVTLEVLSYHATAPREESQKLVVSTFSLLFVSSHPFSFVFCLVFVLFSLCLIFLYLTVSLFLHASLLIVPCLSLSVFASFSVSLPLHLLVLSLSLPIFFLSLFNLCLIVFLCASLLIVSLPSSFSFLSALPEHDGK